VAYLNVDEIESALENLAGAYPAATQLITVPHRTHEGRVSHVLRLGAAASGRDGVLILGGVHAREWVPPDALIALAADLLEAFDLGTGLGYGGKSFAVGDVRQLMHTMNVYVYPSGNPDGRQFSQSSDPQWRKNRRRNTGGCIGVDTNRNFDFLWDHLTKFAPDSLSGHRLTPVTQRCIAVHRRPPSRKRKTSYGCWTAIPGFAGMSMCTARCDHSAQLGQRPEPDDADRAELPQQRISTRCAAA
jgi:Zinc carboxypeptidase